jgi:hypothetical protein
MKKYQTPSALMQRSKSSRLMTALSHLSSFVDARKFNGAFSTGGELAYIAHS